MRDKQLWEEAREEHTDLTLVHGHRLAMGCDPPVISTEEISQA